MIRHLVRLVCWLIENRRRKLRPLQKEEEEAVKFFLSKYVFIAGEEKNASINHVNILPPRHSYFAAEFRPRHSKIKFGSFRNE